VRVPAPLAQKFNQSKIRMSSSPALPVKKRTPQPIWVKILIVLAVLVLVTPVVLIATNLSRIYSIPNGAMAPAIAAGDHVVMEGFSYLRRPPRRGDIVVFKTDAIPGLGHETYVKRIVGLPGEELRIDHDALYVNGERVSIRNKEGEIAYRTPNSKFLRTPQETYKIPPGSYFVLGDYAQRSLDSRIWGTLPASAILGRAVWCYWPPARIGHIE